MFYAIFITSRFEFIFTRRWTRRKGMKRVEILFDSRSALGNVRREAKVINVTRTNGTNGVIGG